MIGGLFTRIGASGQADKRMEKGGTYLLPTPEKIWDRPPLLYKHAISSHPRLAMVIQF